MTTHGAGDARAFPTLVHALRDRAEQRPDGWAYTFLVDGDRHEHRVSYAEIHTRARGVARQLAAHGARGARVVLLYPPGIDYIAAFFGCLYAGAVAVPAYPPDPVRLARSLSRLRGIVTDCSARFVLSTAAIEIGRAHV